MVIFITVYLNVIYNFNVITRSLLTSFLDYAVMIKDDPIYLKPGIYFEQKKNVFNQNVFILASANYDLLFWLNLKVS